MMKDFYTPENLIELGLNERQIKAVMYVKERGKITNKEYQEINNVSNKTAYLELGDMVNIGLLAIEGKGRKVNYTLKVMEK